MDNDPEILILILQSLLRSGTWDDEQRAVVAEAILSLVALNPVQFGDWQLQNLSEMDVKELAYFARQTVRCVLEDAHPVL